MTKRSKKFVLESRILCEDIRQEKSNKFILIGVYSGDILAKTFPAPTPLAIFVNGTPQQDDGEFWLRISGPGKGSGKVKLACKRASGSTNVALATPGMELLLEKEGTLKIEWGEDGENWNLLLERKVIQAEDLWALTTISPLPLSEQSPSAAPETSSQP